MIDLGGCEVREATAADLASVADLHGVAFPHYHSSHLGTAFTRRLLGTYLARPEVAFLVAVGRSAPADPLGYLVACPPAVQRRINDVVVPWAAVAAIGQAVRSPSRAVAGARSATARARRALGSLTEGLPKMRHRHRFLSMLGASRPLSTGNDRALVRRGDGGAVDQRADVARSAPASPGTRVVLIGVAHASRGSGVADALLAGFEERAAAQGHRSADLVVAEDNMAASRCYERNGWVRLSAPAAGPADGSVRYTLDLTPKVTDEGAST